MKHLALGLCCYRGRSLLSEALVLILLFSIVFIQPARAATNEVDVEFNAPVDTAEMWLDIPDKALSSNDLTINYSDSPIETVKTSFGLSARVEAKAGPMTFHVRASKHVKTEIVVTFADSGKRILAEQFVELSLDAPSAVIPPVPPSSDPQRNPSNGKTLPDGVNGPRSNTEQVGDMKRTTVETVQAINKSSRAGFAAEDLAKTGTAASVVSALFLLLVGAAYGAMKIGHKQTRRAK